MPCPITVAAAAVLLVLCTAAAAAAGPLPDGFVPLFYAQARIRDTDGYVLAVLGEVPAARVASEAFGVLGGAPRPDAVTHIVVAARQLPMAVDYHLHALRVVDGDCAAAGGHWDPFNASRTATPTPGHWATYEAGDLSGKAGPLTPASNGKKRVIVDPTFRARDVANLSFVVHDATDPQRPRVGCDNLRPVPLQQDAPPLGAELAATATNSQGKGQLRVSFREIDAATVPPAVFNVLAGKVPPPQTLVEVVVRAENLPTGIDYAYHIHENALASPDDCDSAGAHYDPGHVHPPGTDYHPDASDWTSFEAGDLSGKYGTVPGGGLNLRVAQDPTLRLADIASKSIVLHGRNGTRLGCANLAFGQGIATWDTLDADPGTRSAQSSLALPLLHPLPFVSLFISNLLLLTFFF